MTINTEVMRKTHTMQPWAFQGVGGAYDITARASLTADHAGIYIARLEGRAGYETMSGDEREANARLIAAAPDMFHALMRIVHDRGVGGNVRMRKIARDALAKLGG
jgi:hypothetical protein